MAAKHSVTGGVKCHWWGEVSLYYWIRRQFFRGLEGNQPETADSKPCQFTPVFDS